MAKVTQIFKTPNEAAKESSLRTSTNISHFCNKCQKKCMVPGNRKATQEAALAMFGIIPNPCPERCPY